jgi:cytochrome c
MKTKLIGPSLEEVSKRYSRTPLNIERLANHIKNGSTGIWGTSGMPAHPELTTAQTMDLAEWIIRSAADPTLTYYRGIEGAFWSKPNARASKAVYVLTSTYIDHGTNGNLEDSYKGQDVVIIKER